jgi:hypothetical protein
MVPRLPFTLPSPSSGSAVLCEKRPANQPFFAERTHFRIPPPLPPLPRLATIPP